MRGVGAAAGVAGLGLAGCVPEHLEDHFRQHYHRLSDEDKREIFARIEAVTFERFGVEVRISDPPPLPGVEFGYALNLTYCIGCRRCELACARENNTSRDPQIHYIRVLQLEKGSLDLEHAEVFYEGEVPTEEHFYMPVRAPTKSYNPSI
jgi:molybdopterin-containing oxidoreductase family iron-sulfur binding subunit